MIMYALAIVSFLMSITIQDDWLLQSIMMLLTGVCTLKIVIDRS